MLKRKDVVFWTSLVVVISTIVITVIEVLRFAGDIPEYVKPYIPCIELGIGIALIILTILIVIAMVISRRKRIGQWLARRYLGKLERRIREELENEVTNNKLVFSRQSKKDVLSILASRLSSDIVGKTTPKKYVVQPVLERDDDVEVWLGEDIVAIPFSEAEILAHKMTELSKNPKYRGKSRWLYLFWVR